MWLSDLIKAAQIMMSAHEDFCLSDVSLSFDGKTVGFHTTSSDGRYYVSNSDTGRVELHWPDTWRNPEHREIIAKGE